MKTNTFFPIAAVALGMMISTPAAAVENCGNAPAPPDPGTLEYSAPANLEKYLGAYAGRLGEGGDKACLVVYVVHVTERGFLEGKYAIGNWSEWKIKEVVYDFTGKIDLVTGKGMIHPKDLAAEVDIDPEEGTMDFLFLGRSTNTPGDLVRIAAR